MLPPPRSKAKEVYLKLRDRASYEFALSSAAVIAEVTNGRFTYVRTAMGGIATKSWPLFDFDTEKALMGATVIGASRAVIQSLLQAAVAGPNAPFNDAKPDDLQFGEGKVSRKATNGLPSPSAICSRGSICRPPPVAENPPKPTGTRRTRSILSTRTPRICAR